MPQATSRLALLMQILRITGYDLANNLDIDPSLISKWKRNRRRMPGRTDAMQKIAGYLLEVDSRQFGHAIRPLIQAMAGDETVSDSQAAELLTQWLLDPEPPDWFPDPKSGGLIRSDCDSYTCPIEVFRGITGRRKAILRMFGKIAALPAGTRLLVMTQEDISWIEGDPAFVSQCKAFMLNWLASGHQLEIVHWVNRQPEHLMAIIKNWLPLHLQASVKSWYYPLYGNMHLPMTTIIVPGHLAIRGSQSDLPLVEFHTVLYSDQLNVRQYEYFFQSVCIKCLPLINNFQPDDINQLLQRFEKKWDQVRDRSVRFQSSLPMLLNLPAEQLCKILAENGITGTRQRELLQSWSVFTGCHDDKLQPGKGISQTQLVHHLEAIENILNQPDYVDQLLSGLAGQPIRVRQQYFRELLAVMAKNLQMDKNLEIALVPSDIYRYADWPNLLIISDNFLVAWGNKPTENQVLIQETTLVHAFNQYFQERWLMIPRIHFDREQVAAKLASLAQPAAGLPEAASGSSAT